MAISPLSRISEFSSPKMTKETDLPTKSFGDYLMEVPNSVAQAGRQAENQGLLGIAGQGDLVTTMTALEELGLGVKLMMEFHKKAVQAYRDINQTAL